MKKANKSLRVFALALCLMTVFTVAAPALAASIYAYGTVSADNTPVYSTSAKTTTLGVFNKNDIVAIESQVSAQGLYVVRLSGSTTSVGYISKAAVSGLRYSLKSGTSVAGMKAVSGGTATTGNAGVIANCNSYVNFRAAASTSSTILGKLYKGAAVSILGTEGSFYKVIADGKTGYVATAYVSVTGTTPTTPTSPTTPTATTGVVGNTSSSYVPLRRTASSTSSRLVNVKVGTTVTILGTSGSFYQVKVSSRTGYMETKYINVSGGGGGSGDSTTGTPGVIANCNSYVNFRATASASGTLLGTLKKGTALTILGTQGSYTKVIASGKTGYVSSTYVSATTTETPSNNAGQGTDTGKITLGTGAIKVTPYQSTAISTVKTKLAAAQKTNSKTIGYININGTNIQQPILFYSSSNVHYYSTHDIRNKTASAGAVYAFYKDMARNNTITGHNMRGSNAMFHQLHHIQEKTLGYSKCQTTDYTCKGSFSSAPSLTSAANRTWDVSLFGYNKWEVWAMYETPAKEPSSTLKYNINPLSSYKPAQIKTWIEYQKGRSEYKFNTAVSTDDVFLTVYTCGTNYDYAAAQSRIYFFLKAVK